jgi:alanine racemase
VSARSPQPQKIVRLPHQHSAEAGAGAVLSIDLGAVRANYRILRGKLAGKPCAAAVKADAYGLGADEVAKALTREGCDSFFVADVNEGVSLRAALGAKAAIYLLNGLSHGSEQSCVEANLFPVLNSIDQVTLWRAHAARLSRKLPAALQVDSGMARLGMPPAEVEALAADAHNLDGIDLRLVVSHLACADEPEHPANRAQRQEFERLRALLPKAPASFANSSGIFLGSDYHYDLGRPGAALYGINPTPHLQNPMHRVVGLAARIIQLRAIPAGAGIGYGHTFSAKQPMRLATIALGYADGWHRKAVAAAFHQGRRLPFVGRISMDSIILDVSDVPPGSLKPGDLVELIGQHQTVDDVARLAGTIGYEIIASFGQRFHRVYMDETG